MKSNLPYLKGTMTIKEKPSWEIVKPEHKLSID